MLKIAYHESEVLLKNIFGATKEICEELLDEKVKVFYENMIISSNEKIYFTDKYEISSTKKTIPNPEFPKGIMIGSNTEINTDLIQTLINKLPSYSVWGEAILPISIGDNYFGYLGFYIRKLKDWFKLKKIKEENNELINKEGDKIILEHDKLLSSFHTIFQEYQDQGRIPNHIIPLNKFFKEMQDIDEELYPEKRFLRFELTFQKAKYNIKIIGVELQHLLAEYNENEENNPNPLPDSFEAWNREIQGNEINEIEELLGGKVLSEVKNHYIIEAKKNTPKDLIWDLVRILKD